MLWDSMGQNHWNAIYIVPSVTSNLIKVYTGIFLYNNFEWEALLLKTTTAGYSSKLMKRPTGERIVAT